MKKFENPEIERIILATESIAALGDKSDTGGVEGDL